MNEELINLSMTQKELREAKQRALDKDFIRKYPDGSFTIQIFDVKDKRSSELHWSIRRNTSRVKRCGISISMSKETGRLYFSDYQNCSFGKVKIFKSLEEMVNQATKWGVPEKMINEFVSRVNKAQEIIKCDNDDEYRTNAYIKLVRYIKLSK